MTVHGRAKLTRLLGAAALVGAALALSGCYVAPYPYQYRGGGYYGAAPVYVAPYRYGRPYY
jgi:hypothetical protein